MSEIELRHQLTASSPQLPIMLSTIAGSYPHHTVVGNTALCVTANLSRLCPRRVIVVRSTRFQRSRHVRFAPFAYEPSHNSNSTRCARSDQSAAQQIGT